MEIIDYNEKILTKEGQSELVSAMQGLKKTKGWAVTCAYLSRLRILVQDQINNIDSPLSPDDLLRKRIELHYIDWLLQFPDELIKTLGDKEEEEETEHLAVY